MDGHGGHEIERRSSENEPVALGQVLSVLHEVKSEIIAEVNRRNEELRQEMTNKLNSVKTEILGKVGSSSIESRSTGSRARPASERSRRQPQVEPDNVPWLNELSDAERGIVPHMKWVMLLSVLSFANGQPNAKSWLTEEALERTGHAANAVAGVSGLSLIFFAVPRSDTRLRFTGRIAQAWSFVLRMTVVSMIMSVNKTITSSTASEGGDLPDWLASFGGRRKASAIVDDLFASLVRREVAASEDGDRRMGPKRRRMERQEVKQPYCGDRRAGVKATRTNLMAMLTHGRTEARRQLYEHLWFLVEKIWSFRSPSEAKGAGFEFQIPDAQGGGQLEICDLDENSESRWNVARMETEGDSFAVIDENNLEEFTKLQAAFPELTVTLKYVKKVRKPPNTSAIDVICTEESPTWSVVEKVSLHSVASAIFLGAYKVDTFAEILRSCELSLCVIHVFAIGLRALIRQSMGLELEPLEKCALGDVTCKLLEKGDTAVTAMYGCSTREKDNDDVSLLKKSAGRSSK